MLGSLSAQQITKFAVVDTARIYSTFYRDSRNVRDYEAKKTQYQAEMQRMADEIKEMRQQKVDSAAANDQSKALRLEADITQEAVNYLRIISFGVPFMFLILNFSGIYIGTGRSDIPFYFNAVGLVLNIVLDPL
ncbi:MAG TPA: MATE family efflux transporter, partial [Treponemataceae bacterium]|nr:MATE family efflux transporter [Treponemataceae bacterium]